MNQQRGFTLVEIVAAVSVAALVLALAIPSSIRFFESMQFRAGIREVATMLNAARYHAVAEGRSQDVAISPEQNWVRFGDKEVTFDETVSLRVDSAREVNRDRLGIIRFYPDGGSSGGGVEIEREQGGSVSISVDWLVGRVTLAFGVNDV